VLLNVHQTEMPYFEWQRLVFYGVWQQAAVVTEQCMDVPFLKNGEHYLGVRHGELAPAVENVLSAISRGDAAPQQMVEGAWSVLTSHYRLSECITRI
jgi:hypothetical protein